MTHLCPLPSLCLFSLSIPFSVSLTSSSPHPVVLLGFLLFLGRYVCPDHVGDAAHSGRLCAEVQRPCSLSRLVSLNVQEWWDFSCCNWQHFSLSHLLFIFAPMRCCHNDALHYNCFLYRPVLKHLPVWYQCVELDRECFLSGCNSRQTQVIAVH